MMTNEARRASLGQEYQSCGAATEKVLFRVPKGWCECELDPNRT